MMMKKMMMNKMLMLKYLFVINIKSRVDVLEDILRRKSVWDSSLSYSNACIAFRIYVL